MRIILALLLGLSSTIFGATYSDVDSTTIRIVSDPWPKYIDPNGGYFLELGKKIFEPYGYTVTAENMPFARALFEVKKGKADIAPALYKSYHQGIVNADQFTAVDVTAIIINTNSITWYNGINSIAGHKVGWIREFGFARYLMDKHRISVENVEVNNRASGMGMLQAGRIDAYMDNAHELEIAAQSMGLREPEFKTYTAYQKGLYFGFTDNGKSPKIKNIFFI